MSGITVNLGYLLQSTFSLLRKEEIHRLQSAVSRARALAAAARSSDASRVSDCICASNCLVVFIASNEFALIRDAANEAASRVSIFFSLTQLMRPIRYASFASITVPASTSCRARPSPIFRIRNDMTMAGTKLIFTLVYPKLEFAVAKEKSHTVTRPHPT